MLILFVQFHSSIIWISCVLSLWRHRGRKDPVFYVIILQLIYHPVHNEFFRRMKPFYSFHEVFETGELSFFPGVYYSPHEFFTDPWKQFKHVQSGSYRICFVKKYQEFILVRNHYFLYYRRKLHLGCMGDFRIDDPSLDMVYYWPVSITYVNFIMRSWSNVLFWHHLHENEMFLSDSLNKWLFLIHRSGIIRAPVWQIIKNVCHIFSFCLFIEGYH